MEGKRDVSTESVVIQRRENALSLYTYIGYVYMREEVMERVRKYKGPRSRNF
mgnify:CR=1 FL=1